jgi:PPK2 family polyphosphate:nucleotide phosphotransferase
MNYQDFLVPEGKQIKLANIDADFTGKYKNKEEAVADLVKHRERIADLQEKMFAQNTQAIVVIFQAMDAAGKDSAIKHIFTGVNPAGFQVAAFAAPSKEELDHDFLWRATLRLPERGRIGVFSRSYYEEVLAVRVHKEILAAQPLPSKIKNDKNIWRQRLEDIRNYELYLTRNGISILKFFLLTSKDEQKKQLMQRLNDSTKHWKFAFSDLQDRAFWNDFMRAYEKVFAATSAKFAPWYVVPCNKRWFARAVIAQIIADKMDSMNLAFPEPSAQQLEQIAQARKILEKE